MDHGKSARSKNAPGGFAGLRSGHEAKARLYLHCRFIRQLQRLWEQQTDSRTQMRTTAERRTSATPAQRRHQATTRTTAHSLPIQLEAASTTRCEAFVRRQLSRLTSASHTLKRNHRIKHVDTLHVNTSPRPTHLPTDPV